MMMMNEDTLDDVTSLSLRLEALRGEHRDLDEAISRLAGASTEDELLLRRLKKHKLAIKDRITSIERLLQPGDFA